jgi:myo-inositol-1(or 4)-monophosphatase
MTDLGSERALERFHEVADAVAAQLAGVVDWAESGRRRGQYRADVGADDVAVPMLLESGFAVLSEESGRSGPGSGLVVVVDPLDGSTNASRGLRWFATALCLVDEHGPAVALVADQASGERWWATRGGGAFRGQHAAPVALTPSACRRPENAIVGISGPPTGDYGWAQFRALGAAALDLCLVAAGVLDAYVDMSHDAHGVWDYLAGALICREAGAVVADAGGRELTVVDHAARRTPVAAATPELLDALIAVRRR